MLMPWIERYMTRQPWTIGAHASLLAAHELMRERRIRHLPVMSDGNLVGLVSARDLRLLEAVASASPVSTHVNEAMTEHVFTVAAATPIRRGRAGDVQHKYGSAVVIGKDGVEGIFTTVDACRALAELARLAVGSPAGEPLARHSPPPQALRIRAGTRLARPVQQAPPCSSILSCSAVAPGRATAAGSRR